MQSKPEKKVQSKPEKKVQSKPEKKVQSKPENRYTKEQVLASKKISYSKDLINAILSEDRPYTFSEVEAEIKAFMKRKVN